MLSAIAVPALLAAALVAPVSPPAEPLSIDSVEYHGSGCPDGTVGVTPAEDNSGFALDYEKFFAEVGAGMKPDAQQQTCQVNFQLKAPEGYTLGFDTVIATAAARLDAGVAAQLTSTIQIDGSQPRGVKVTIDGPKDGFIVTDGFKISGSPTYLPCGEVGDVQIDTTVTILNADPERFPSSWAAFKHPDYVAWSFSGQWEKCD